MVAVAIATFGGITRVFCGSGIQQPPGAMQERPVAPEVPVAAFRSVTGALQRHRSAAGARSVTVAAMCDVERDQ